MALKCGTGEAGVLDEPAVFVDPSRPADVMIDDDMSASQGPERIAIDVEVINALGSNDYQETLSGPLVAAANYRELANSRLDTQARCAARGIRYEAVVFTTQGGCDKHAEAIIAQIAGAVAKQEGKQAAAIKAEMMEDICQSIARSVAKAVMRRRPRFVVSWF